MVGRSLYDAAQALQHAPAARLGHADAVSAACVTVKASLDLGLKRYLDQLLVRVLGQLGAELSLKATPTELLIIEKSG